MAKVYAQSSDVTLVEKKVTQINVPVGAVNQELLRMISGADLVTEGALLKEIYTSDCHLSMLALADLYEESFSKVVPRCEAWRYLGKKEKRPIISGPYYHWSPEDDVPYTFFLLPRKWWSCIRRRVDGIVRDTADLTPWPTNKETLYRLTIDAYYDLSPETRMEIMDEPNQS